MSLNILCSNCEHSDCNEYGITCQKMNPAINDSGQCLDYINAGEGTNPRTNEVS